MLKERGKVVIVCGLIGSGKSTLARETAAELGPKTLLLEEPDEKGGRNPYLQDYYKEPQRWSYVMQSHLLSQRFRLHLQAQRYAMNTGYHAVMDSAFYQDTAFARLQLKSGLMSEREFETYATLYQDMTSFVLFPTACLHIITSPETCRARIARRMETETGRRCENAVSLEYLTGLDEEITRMVDILRMQGVAVRDVPWGADRDTVEIRRETVQDLARCVLAIRPPDPFLDIHRRVI